MTIDTIRVLQRQIVAKLEAGEDVSKLTRWLAEERAEIAAKLEIDELTKIAAQRIELRDKAAKVQERAKLQGEAIDKALQNGRSLRDIEAEFGVSRSILSMHKQHIAQEVEL